jgi:Uma2 family endonuclease
MRLDAGTARFYPDVFVACGPGLGTDPDTHAIPTATVIVEVLSPPTESYDRGTKWLKYQGLPDLQHYVLAAQDQRRVEAFHREGAAWRYELLQAPDAVLSLAAIGVALRLDEIYAVLPGLPTDAPHP